MKYFIILNHLLFAQVSYANQIQCSSIFLTTEDQAQHQKINQIIDVLVEYYFESIYEKPENNQSRNQNQIDTEIINQSEHFKLLASLNLIRKKYGEESIQLFYKKVDNRILNKNTDQ